MVHTDIDDEHGNLTALVEFVIFFPRLLLRLVILDVGVVGTQMLQLSFVTEGAAKGEASRPGTGAACGTSQLVIGLGAMKSAISGFAPTQCLVST